MRASPHDCSHLSLSLQKIGFASENWEQVSVFSRFSLFLFNPNRSAFPDGKSCGCQLFYLFVMRYLTVDGYFDGTGIRDAANGGYLEHDEVGISPDLSKRIDVWLEQYWKEFIKGFPDRDKVVELDEEGIRIARRLKKEFPEDKIGYFSDARMVALYDEKVHGGF